MRGIAESKICLTLSWQRSLSCRDQSIDFLCKWMDWFLYDRNLRHERANCEQLFLMVVTVARKKVFDAIYVDKESCSGLYFLIHWNYCISKILQPCSIRNSSYPNIHDWVFFRENWCLKRAPSKMLDRILNAIQITWITFHLFIYLFIYLSI